MTIAEDRHDTLDAPVVLLALFIAMLVDAAWYQMRHNTPGATT